MNDGDRFGNPFDAVLFDLDGVVTDTASVHATAWQELFDSVLTDPRLTGNESRLPFDRDADYRSYVDGRAREDGIVAFLASRGIELPVGLPEDPPAAWTVHGLAARKNQAFLAALARDGVRTYPGTTALLHRLRAGRVPVGLVTASMNARPILANAHLDGLFDVVIDGTAVRELALAGKPDPAMFLEAARRLGASPKRTAIVEDALAGVEAGRRGGFGLVVGIDRTGHRDQLEAAGADLVLGDVGQLDLGAARTDPWLLVYEGFDPGHEGHRETLTTLGNGYQATRGARPERSADGIHYPGSYLAGIYNRMVRTAHGNRMEEEHLVNAPNWLPLDLRIGSGPWWSADQAETGTERHELDLRAGVLTRHATLTGPGGRRLTVVQRRLVSMASPHLAALETTVTPEGWSGRISVRAGIDGAVSNTNVPGYDGAAGQHLSGPSFEETDVDTVLCEVETLRSHVRLALAVRTTVTGDATISGQTTSTAGGRHTRQFDVQLHDGRSATVAKTAATFTSRDPATATPGLGALAELARSANGVSGLLDAHRAAWGRLWDRFAVTIDADRHSQLILNLHMFHLLQTVSPHTAALDAGVPARGLNGEGYRGHVFWDELFVLPVIGLRRPDVSAALLEYRWRRLDAARDAAREAGLAGALFPWQSGSDGREETPRQLFNTRSARWMPDNSRRQRHVSLAVAFNAWQHFQVTGDREWLSSRGAEIIVEVARLFSSLADYDPDSDRFHISGVMGPDEYHDGYPDAPGEGVRDNAYTNVLVSWVCERAGDALAVLAGHSCDDLTDRLRIRPEEVSRWEHLSRRIAVPFHSNGIISQFDGFDDLVELDWARYRATYGNVGRLDLILEAEGDATNRYKLAKQADVLMLLYLLGSDATLDRLARLGYPITGADLRRTVEYYLSRTAHGSTLSRVVEAAVLSRIDRPRAWAAFREALVADLDDTQGGTTREGIHIGAMAGTTDLAVRAFAGLHTDVDSLTFTPRLPPRLHRLAFQVVYRGQRIDVSVNQERLRVHLHRCSAPPVRIGVNGRLVMLTGGESVDFALESGALAPEQECENQSNEEEVRSMGQNLLDTNGHQVVGVRS
ncbi:beta-phosphoglucomutase family hydrolase [Cryobacterium fucosi]|uniref:Beta-phosphoglucomutase family hydrolase n=1 Tax=Cryobacterium fucosi TaxID=1259157 RepID=A0A4R9BDA1_9MICO|nr:beta-phosphoglucomutase family hydrolase [Cryobacterium fucosi]TFD81586.1 beta-phosphoglucomutase family hydrolase [Cryobacterium fucosi]